jgi:hypothetical protein
MTSANSNTLTGENAGAALTTGARGIAIGNNSNCSDTGTDNTTTGVDAGSASTGSYNTVYGAVAGSGAITGDHNTIGGWSAGTAIGSGSNNTLYGNQAEVGDEAAENRLALGHGTSAEVDNAGQVGNAAFTNLKIGTTLGSIETGDTTNTTSVPWMLGDVVVAAAVLDATQYVEVMIDGVLVKLAIIQ